MDTLTKDQNKLLEEIVLPEKEGYLELFSNDGDPGSEWKLIDNMKKRKQIITKIIKLEDSGLSFEEIEKLIREKNTELIDEIKVERREGDNFWIDVDQVESVVVEYRPSSFYKNYGWTLSLIEEAKKVKRKEAETRSVTKRLFDEMGDKNVSTVTGLAHRLDPHLIEKIAKEAVKNKREMSGDSVEKPNKKSRFFKSGKSKKPSFKKKKPKTKKPSKKKKSSKEKKSKKKIGRRDKRRNKSKKRIPRNKTKMRGGLKPTELGVATNRDDPQVGRDVLLEFYQRRTGEGITYPPLSTDVSELHIPKLEFARESIEYPITSIEGFVIKIDTSERSIRKLTSEQSQPINPNLSLHSFHDYHPYNVEATIKEISYVVKTIDGDTITLFTPIPPGTFSVGDKVTISRNRRGDFVIYTQKPTTLRYLDNALQNDFKQFNPFEKVGHYSLLDSPYDYEQSKIRGVDATPRGEDTILYAGSIMWREDGRALYYNNDCGRYQPDEGDSDYLAEINPDFKKNIVTVTPKESLARAGFQVDEDMGRGKKFYRKHEHKSGLLFYCQSGPIQSRAAGGPDRVGISCGPHEIDNLRKGGDGRFYCETHYPSSRGCECEGCRYSSHCERNTPWEQAERLTL